METHYQTAEKSSLDTWFPTKNGGFERYGFGFDQRDPVHDSKTRAYATYQFDPADNQLTIVANPQMDMADPNPGSMKVKCGDAAQAIDYAKRFDAALSEVVADAAPRSMMKLGMDVPAWTGQPETRGKSFSGVMRRKDMDEVLATADQAVRASYDNAPAEDFAQLSKRSGLLPVTYDSSLDGFTFKGGNGSLFMQSSGKDTLVYSTEPDKEGDYPLLAKGKTPAQAIAAAAKKYPDMVSGMVEHGKEAQFQGFVVAEKASAAASASIAAAGPDHTPYRDALKLMGNTPPAQALHQSMLAGKIDREARVKAFTGGPAPVVDAKAPLTMTMKIGRDT